MCFRVVAGPLGQNRRCVNEQRLGRRAEAGLEGTCVPGGWVIKTVSVRVISADVSLERNSGVIMEKNLNQQRMDPRVQRGRI